MILFSTTITKVSNNNISVLSVVAGRDEEVGHLGQLILSEGQFVLTPVVLVSSLPALDSLLDGCCKNWLVMIREESSDYLILVVCHGGTCPGRPAGEEQRPGPCGGRPSPLNRGPAQLRDDERQTAGDHFPCCGPQPPM